MIPVLAIYVELWLDIFFILISRMKRKIAEVFRSVASVKYTRTLHVACILTSVSHYPVYYPGVATPATPELPRTDFQCTIF